MTAIHISVSFSMVQCPHENGQNIYLQEVQGKLCTADRQAAVVKSLQTQHKLMLLHLDDAFAVVELLQAQVVDAACNDPASLILPHLVIPLLRDRMEALERDPEVRRWQFMSYNCCRQQPPVCAALPSTPVPYPSLRAPSIYKLVCMWACSSYASVSVSAMVLGLEFLIW